MDEATHAGRSDGQILLVAGNRLDAARAREALVAAGFAVELRHSGEEAIASAAEQIPDLVLLDVQLPDMPGRDLAHHLRRDAATAHIPIVFLAGSFHQVEELLSGFDQGTADYLRLPLDEGELVARVRALLAGGQTRAELERREQLLLLVSQVARQLVGILDLDALLAAVARLIQRNFHYPAVHVLLLEEDELVLVAAAGRHARKLLADPPAVTIHGSGLAATAARSGRLRFTTPARGVEHPFAPDARCGVAVPINAAGSLCGVVELAGPAAFTLDDDEKRVLQAIADVLGLAMHTSELRDEMGLLAILDGLTGLLNRRALLSQLELEWARSQRYRRPVGLIAVDVDGFRPLNERHGHATGDLVLESLGDLIGCSVRAVDHAGRVGGDEFLVVLPETDQEGATRVAERLRLAGERLVVEGGEGPSITLSLGVAAWPQTGAATPDDLVRIAEQALQLARGAGGNRISLVPTE